MHQNTLERVTVFLVLLLAAGLFNAKMAAAFGLVWLLARVIYSVGYYSGTPSNRIVGSMVRELLLSISMFCHEKATILMIV